MDKWKDLELEKMKAGGNRKARLFFESQDDYHEGMSISEKYNSKAAALYRDKILHEAQGKPWSVETSSARNYVSSVVQGRLSSSSSYPRFDGGSEGGSGAHRLPSMHSYASNSMSMDTALDSNQDEIAQIAQSRNDFFTRRQTENANRPDNLPPNQGGRYAGFGNTVEPDKKEYDYWSVLSSGWSNLAEGATKFAAQATEKATTLAASASQKTKELGQKVNEKVKEGTVFDSVSQSVTSLTSKVKDGSLINGVSSSVSDIATKVQSAGLKGWRDISTMFSDDPKSAGDASSPGEKSNLLTAGSRGYSVSSHSEAASPGTDEWTGWGDAWGSGSPEQQKPSSPGEDKAWDGWGDDFDKTSSDNGRKAAKSKSPSRQKESAKDPAAADDNLMEFADFGGPASNGNASRKPAEKESDWNNEVWAAEDDEWQALELDSKSK